MPNSPQTLKQRARRRRIAFYSVLGGFVLSSIAAFVAWQIESSRDEKTRNFTATTVANSLQATLTTVESRLHSLRGIFALKRNIAPQEFLAFARELQPVPAIRDYQFVRQIRQGAVVDYLQRQSDLRDRPFRIVERDDENGLVPASPRPFHYPVEFVFPQDGKEDVLGLDLASMPVLFAALREAWESGEETLSGLFQPARAGAPPMADMFLAFTDYFAGEEEMSRGAIMAEIDVEALVAGVGTAQARIIGIENVATGARFVDLPSPFVRTALLERNVIAGTVPWVVRVAVAHGSLPLTVALLVFGVGSLLTVLTTGGIYFAGLRAENRIFGQKLLAKERILEVREMAYQSLFYNAGTANMEIDLGTRQIIRSNDRAAFMTGYLEHELAGMEVNALFDPEHCPALEIAIASIKAGGGGVTAPQFECRVLSRDGEGVWALANLGDATETENGVVSACLVMQDITARKESEGAREMLVRELAHRLRNTMQLVSSLADQTLQSVDTPAEYRNRLQGRLRALNAAHDALFDTNWAPVRLDRLAKRVLAAFEPLEGDSERISVDVVPVMLPPWQLQSIALALHELGSNAIRHGALKYPDGKVELKIELLAHDNGGDDETLKLSWHERSASATWEKPARRGFGTVMLDNLLERQYDGATEMEWREDGFFFNAILPLRAVKEG